MGASAQARKVSDEHRQRAEVSKNLEHALNQATEELVLEKRHRQYLLEDMSKLELEIERMGKLSRGTMRHARSWRRSNLGMPRKRIG